MEIVIVTPPAAGFTADVTEGCAPLTVQFDQSSETPPPGPGHLPCTPAGSTASDPVVQYLSPGVYGVTLTVSNAAGSDSHSIAQYITVQADQRPGSAT